MTDQQKLSFSELQAVILLVMYELMVRDIGEEIRTSEIREHLKNISSRILIKRALGEVNSHEYIWSSNYNEENPLITLTNSGIKRAESLRETAPGLIDLVQTTFSTNTSSLETNKIPASDRTVNIDHNKPIFRETVSALEKVIHEFRNDHKLDNELSHEKNALLKALEGGRDLLEDTSINLRIGMALLIEPLQRIAEKYDQALVGALAATALGLTAKLLGLG